MQDGYFIEVDHAGDRVVLSIYCEGHLVDAIYLDHEEAHTLGVKLKAFGRAVEMGNANRGGINAVGYNHRREQ